MKVPTIEGTIRRRLLLNYRVAPEICAAILPPKFRPKLIRGHAIVGICLIRLEHIRPKGFPQFIGIASENSAHRIAVEWDEPDGTTQSGVFIPRRDTDSLLNSLAGGRLFPGVHHRSKFSVRDEGDLISIRVQARSFSAPLVDVVVKGSGEFPIDSVFESLAESSKFFERGSLGYSADSGSTQLDGLRLDVKKWEVNALAVDRLTSAFFDDAERFPPSHTTFDHALLMRDIPHEWHALPPAPGGGGAT